MLKKLIFFEDIRLYKDCELQAERREMSSAEDFIVDSLAKYFQKKNPEKIYKKNIDLWLACEQEKIAMGGDGTIADFIEAVARQAIYGNIPVDSVAIREVQKSARQMHWWQKISESMSLPKG